MIFSSLRVFVCAVALLIAQSSLAGTNHQMRFDAPYEGNFLFLAAVIDLNEIDRRKLDFFADKILSDLFDIANSEQAGNGEEINGKIHSLQLSARRFTTSTSKLDLTDDEASQYLLGRFRLIELRGSLICHPTLNRLLVDPQRMTERSAT